MSLREYQRKRNFAVTSEPKGGGEKAAKRKRFVIQKHDASRLHYDFRLEINGTLVSWAVPKGLPLVKGEKHLAVKVEDHPISYINFEGTIPKGEYGGGTVQVWDRGTYEVEGKSAMKELDSGKLHFTLHGKKLEGAWYLVRLRDEDQWLVIKAGEDHKQLGKAREEKSAISGKTLAQISKGKRVWHSNRSSGDDVGKAKVKKAHAPASKARPKTAPRKRLPSAKFIVPMMARLMERPPPGEWSYEIKFDGFRALAYKQGEAVYLLSRTNHDLSEKFPEVAEAIPQLRAKEAIVDGEIVALDREGRSSFQLLQAYELGEERPPLCYYAFDLLSLDGEGMLGLPLEERRKKLEGIIPHVGKGSLVRYSATLGDDAEKLMRKAASLGLEGLIGKRNGSVYEDGRRTGAWIKLKLTKEQEFVIGGHTEPGGSRMHIGALLVGVYQRGKLVYAGKVGTGFTTAMLADLARRFKTLKRETCPFADLPEEREGRYGQGITPSVMKKCRWLKPELVCQVRFTEWTSDGRLRHPAFMGLREDKDPKKVIREPVAKAA